MTDLAPNSQVDVLICPLCGSSESLPFDQRTFHSYLITNRLCKQCGLVFLSPRMSQEKLDQFYLSEYRRLTQGDAAPIQKDLAVQTARAAHLFSFLRTHGVSKVVRHLDIGSSAGILLQTVQSNSQNEAVGIEPGQAYRETAQKAGLRIYPRLEDLSHEQENRFDLVSLVHVLEHLPDPVGALKGIRKEWLAPGGLLLIEVPNLYCHDSFEVAHLASYSQHTLKQVLAKAGYRILVSNIHGKPRSSLLPLYITLLAVPMAEGRGGIPETVLPESSVAIKRRLGLARRRLLERLLPSLAWVPFDRLLT